MPTGYKAVSLERYWHVYVSYATLVVLVVPTTRPERLFLQFIERNVRHFLQDQNNKKTEKFLRRFM